MSDAGIQMDLPSIILNPHKLPCLLVRPPKFIYNETIKSIPEGELNCLSSTFLPHRLSCAPPAVKT